MGRPTGYEPLGLPKPFGDNIWIVDGPHIRFYGMPFSTRMTVIRMADGGLWLHSPIALTDDLLAQVEALGPIRHLVAPNWIHYASVHQWQEKRPETVTWAAPGVRERAAKYGVPIRIDYVLGNDMAAPWSGEIPLRHVTGSKVHSEVVFFHVASATLILTDLIENFEPRKLPFWMRWLIGLMGMSAPDGLMPRDIALSFRKNRNCLRGHINWMLARNPRKVILAHGLCYEERAEARLRHAFRQVLPK